MAWNLLFPVIFVFAMVDGFIANRMYPDVLPLLYKDFLIIFVFILFAMKENVLRIVGYVRDQMGNNTFSAAFGFMVVCIFQMFNPLSPGLFLGILGFKIYFLYWLVIPMAYVYFDRPEKIRSFLKLIVLCSVPVNIFGMYQFYSDPGELAMMLGPGFQRALSMAAIEGANVSSFIRIIGTFASTGQYSSFLGMNIMMGFGLYLTSRAPGEKMLWLGCQLLNFMALLAAGSRGSMLFVISNFVIFAMMSKRSRPVIAGAAIMSLCLYAGFNWLGKGVQARFKTLQQSSMIKHRTVETTQKMFSSKIDEYPMGRGLGSATTAARHLQTPALRGKGEWVFVENYPSKLQVETGLPGFAAFYLFWFLLLKRWISEWRLDWIGSHHELAVSMSSYGITYLMLVSVFGIFDTSPGYLFFWAVVVMVIRFSERSFDSEPRPAPAVA